MTKILAVIRYSKKIPKQARKAIQKALDNLKIECPDHHFLILPESMNLEEVPENVMLEAGWVKLGRIEANEAELVREEINKDHL